VVMGRGNQRCSPKREEGDRERRSLDMSGLPLLKGDRGKGSLDVLSLPLPGRLS